MNEYIDEDTIKISNKFSKIKGIPVKTNRKGHTGIGKTLEDILLIEENNYDSPDLDNFEIKSHSEHSKSFSTLFTKSATYPRAANTMLRKKYGSNDSIYPEIKVFHISVFANKWTPNKNKEFELKLKLNNKEKRLELYVRNILTKKVDSIIYWSYEVLEKTMLKKMKKLAYIKAKKIIDSNHDEYFEYLSMQLFFDLSFEFFLKAIKRGEICFDLRMGAYKTGSKKGKSHDHGSGFRIKEKNILKLYKHSKSIS